MALAVGELTPLKSVMAAWLQTMAALVITALRRRRFGVMERVVQTLRRPLVGTHSQHPSHGNQLRQLVCAAQQGMERAVERHPTWLAHWQAHWGAPLPSVCLLACWCGVVVLLSGGTHVDELGSWQG